MDTSKLVSVPMSSAKAEKRIASLEKRGLDRATIEAHPALTSEVVVKVSAKSGDKFVGPNSIAGALALAGLSIKRETISKVVKA